MAKEPTPSRKSPEEIEAMEKEVREYRAAEAAAAQAERREAGKALVDLVEGEAFKTVRDALPELAKLAADRPSDFANLATYVDATSKGLDGLVILVGSMPAIDATAPAGEA